MKIVCISDTHNHLQGITIPEGDVLIHSGDATMNGTIKEVSRFARALSILPHKKKIFVPGNHDYLFDESLSLARSIIKDHSPETEVLMNESFEYMGLKFWGSPVNSNVPGWAFEVSNTIAKDIYQMIPQCDVLITHEPPFGIRDKVLHNEGDPPRNLHIGNMDLLNHVLYKVRPKLHVFGHIHESYGSSKVSDITFINASLLDEEYQIKNKPIIYNI